MYLSLKLLFQKDICFSMLVGFTLRKVNSRFQKELVRTSQTVDKQPILWMIEILFQYRCTFQIEKKKGGGKGREGTR